MSLRMSTALHPLEAPRPAAPVVEGRVTLGDGAATTVHVAAYPLDRTEVEVVLVKARRLADCGYADAIVGGFFTRPGTVPLGEVRTHGVLRAHEPFDAPWSAQRACLHVAGGVPRIAPRDRLPAQPPGDLLQAGPLLVRDGAVVYDRALDPEGFSAGAHQFDSDITAERHPRAALAITDTHLLAVACDGRSNEDAGLTLDELAALMRDMGARSALNLDGGGSTTLIAGGRLRNQPRGGFDRPEPGGRPIATAIVFVSRR